MIWNHSPMLSFLSVIQYLPTWKAASDDPVNSVQTGQLEGAWTTCGLPSPHFHPFQSLRLGSPPHSSVT